MTDETAPPAALLIDARALPRDSGRDTILAAVYGLAVGGAVTIVNDRDIQPLRMVLAMSRPARFDVSYLEAGPEVWRIRITRRR